MPKRSTHTGEEPADETEFLDPKCKNKKRKKVVTSRPQNVPKRKRLQRTAADEEEEHRIEDEVAEEQDGEKVQEDVGDEELEHAVATASGVASQIVAQTKPKKFVFPKSLYGESVSITSRSNLSKVREAIANKLSTNQLTLFRKRCFGDLMQCNVSDQCPTVVHQMLLRQVECDDEDVMEFNFGGKGARFTIKDFALITGLNCGRDLEVEFPPGDTNHIRDTYFRTGDSASVKVERVDEAFRTASFESDEDAVKVSLIYFLWKVLLGDELKKVVDSNHLLLVDHNDLFDNYPWGRVSYKKTISSLRSAMKKSEKNHLNPSKSYTLHGFPLAFQVILDPPFIILCWCEVLPRDFS